MTVARGGSPPSPHIRQQAEFRVASRPVLTCRQLVAGDSGWCQQLVTMITYRTSLVRTLGRGLILGLLM